LKFFLPCALRQNLDKNQDLGKQINSFYVYADNFDNVNKEFLPKKYTQKNISNKTPPKTSSQKFLLKSSSQKNSQKNPKNFQTIFKMSIQFPTSHLEAENPFGLV
jgi:hypothetical protein